MKHLFPIKPLVWMISVTLVYLVVATLNFLLKFTNIEVIQMIWIVVWSIPVYFPVQRFIDMDSILEETMNGCSLII